MKAPAFQTEAQKTFCQTFQKLCSHTSAWQVWSDFVQLTAIALSNRCDMQAKREKQYNEIVQQYDRVEQSVFAELFAQMVTALEEQPYFVGGLKAGTDVLFWRPLPQLPEVQ